jgi:phosphatidylinositol alpha-1,6-mannosyltransferase
MIVTPRVGLHLCAMRRSRATAPVRKTRLMLTHEARLLRARSGAIYNRAGGALNHRALARYLHVFDEVIVVARAADAADQYPERSRVDGPRVSVFPMPYYVGVWGYLFQARQLRRLARQAVTAADAFMLRVPGTLGTVLWRQLMRTGTPYGVEVAGDPWDVFGPGAVGGPLQPLLRRKFTWDMSRQCRHASVAAYVTEHTLQKKYPTDGWSTHYSSIDLPAERIVDGTRVEERLRRLRGKRGGEALVRLC